MGKLLLCELRHLNPYHHLDSDCYLQASHRAEQLFHGAVSKVDPPDYDLHLHHSLLWSHKFSEVSYVSFDAARRHAPPRLDKQAVHHLLPHSNHSHPLDKPYPLQEFAFIYVKREGESRGRYFCANVNISKQLGSFEQLSSLWNDLRWIEG